MNDQAKTKAQLIAELAQLRDRVAGLERELAQVEGRQGKKHPAQDLSEKGRDGHLGDRVLNLSHDLICVAGMDGYFKYVSPAWEKTLGYTEAELLSRPFLDFIHPDDHAKNDAEVARLAQGHATVGFENRYIHEDGSIRHISWTATPIPDEQAMVCIGRDVTEQKRAEEQYRAFFVENISPVFWIEMENPIPIDLPVEEQVEAIFREGYLRDVNESAAQAHGLESREALAGAPLTIVYDPQSVLPGGNVYALYDTFVRAGYKLVQYEAPELSQSGELNWFSNNVQGFIQDGCLVRMWGSFVDITERKEAETRLREREARYRLLFEAANDFVFLHEFDTPEHPGHFLEINSLACRHLGYSADELCQMRPTDIISDSDREAVPDEAEKLTRDQELTFGKNLVAKSGDLIPVEFRARVFEYQGQQLVLSIGRDITERKLANQKLQEREQFARTLLNATNDIAHLIDEDGTIIDLNDAMADALGAPREELIGTCVFDRFPSEIADHKKAAVRDVIREQKPVRFEDEGRSGTLYDSSVYPVSTARGEKAQVVVFAHDITERKRAEEQYKAFFTENVSPVFWAEMKNPIPIDLPVEEQVEAIFREGYVKDVSDATAKMYGLTREELVGQKIVTVYGAEEYQDRNSSVHRYYQHFVQSGYADYLAEAPARTREGKVVWFLATIKGVVEDGHLVRFWGSQIDITERKTQSRRSMRVRKSSGRLWSSLRYRSRSMNPMDGLCNRTRPMRASYALDTETLAGLYETYNVLQDEQARILGLDALY